MDHIQAAPLSQRSHRLQTAPAIALVSLHNLQLRCVYIRLEWSASGKGETRTRFIIQVAGIVGALISARAHAVLMLAAAIATPEFCSFFQAHHRRPDAVQTALLHATQHYMALHPTEVPQAWRIGSSSLSLAPCASFAKVRCGLLVCWKKRAINPAHSEI